MVPPSSLYNYIRLQNCKSHSDEHYLFENSLFVFDFEFDVNFFTSVEIQRFRTSIPRV